MGGSAMQAGTVFNACGVAFGPDEVALVRGAIEQAPAPNRAEVARRVCTALEWNDALGRPKLMSCRVALLRLHRAGLVEFIERYHYLGYTPLPGAQARYLIHAEHGLLGAIGFGACAWRVAPRDRWIGWDEAARERGRAQVLNNARFLILPWIRVRNLASKVLALASTRVREDFPRAYGIEPVLLETFVEVGRFAGTCYRAANWVEVGVTQGRGKLDRHKRAALPIKRVLMRPLCRGFRQVLCA